MFKKKLLLIITMLFIFFINTSLFASPKTSLNQLISAPGVFTVGAGMAVVPEYEGSNKYKATFIPVLDYDNNYIFLSTLRGVGGYLYNNNNIQLTTFANYRAGRDQDDSHVLNGMGDINSNVEFGAQLAWQPNPLMLSTSVTYGLGDVKGFLAVFYLGYQTSFYNFETKIGATASWADTDYMDTFFGVNSQQAFRTGYNAYKGESGLKSTGLIANINYNFTEKVSLSIFGSYDYLASKAAKSPLVKKGSRNQFSSGMTLVFRPFN